MPPGRSPEPAAEANLVTAGRALVDRYECVRCHTFVASASAPAWAHVPAPHPELDCVRCHDAIRAGDPLVVPLEPSGGAHEVQSFSDIPKIEGMHRLRRSFVTKLLLESTAIRPNLGSSMPRFEITSEDAAAIAAFVVPDAEPPLPAVGDAARGRTIAGTHGCGSCHRMTGALLPASPPSIPLTPAELSLGQRLAPDLRHVRDRMRPAHLLEWLRDPSAVKPSAAMPKIPLTERELEDLAAFLLTTPLDPIATSPVPARLPLRERPVAYAEVNERVFGKICRHCHAAEDIIGGGGPGFAGGFGFRKRGLDLSTYDGARSGSIGDDGKRQSVFKPLQSGPLAGTPKLVAHLIARHAEVAGTPVPGVRGMPLGLPPLPLEEIQLVETWIANGRPE